MLTTSLALHLGVVLGILFGHSLATTATVATASPAQTVSLILLGSENNPDLRQPVSVIPLAASLPVTTAPSPVPEIPPAPQAKSEPTAPPPSFALEANPNAHLRALPPESILSPAHAPHLDGHNGVVFLLDVSGSMYEPCAGSTRLTFARETLSQRLRALKDGTPFAIILYAESSKCSGPLVAASPATREAAIRFINRDVNCGGGTNLPDGLAWAKQLHVGSLVLITDGDLNMKLPELLSKARDLMGPEGRCPSLAIVGISPRPHTGDGDMLKSLADQQGGTYRAENFESDTELLTANRLSPGASSTP